MITNPLSLLKLAPWLAILLLLGWSARLNDLRQRHLHMYQSEHAGRLADRATYVAAQKEAAANNKAQVAKVEQQQQRITDDAEARYQSDLARLRAELGKRLQQGNSASPGASGKPGASEVPSATQEPDGSSRVSIPTALYVRGAELELQLERLQQWVAEQVKVDPNKN